MFKNYFPYINVLLIGLLFLFIVEPNKLGVTHDSVFYTEMAEDLLDGNRISLTTPEYSSFWPCVYPLLLSVFSFLLSQDILSAGVYLNFVLIIILGFLFIKILKEINASYIQILILPLVLLLSTPLTISRMLWSELPFLVTLLTSVFYLIKYINNNRLSYLVFCGAFSGISFFVRFSAVGFIGGIIIFFVIFNKKERMKSIMTYFLSFLLVYLLGTYFSYLLGQNPAGRKIDFTIINPRKIADSIYLITRWFLKRESIISVFFASIFFITIVYQLIRLILSNGKIILSTSNKRCLFMFFSLIITYYIFLVIVMIFFGDGIRLDTRMLSPIFIFLPLIISIFFTNFLHQKNLKILNHLSIFFFLICTSLNSYPIWKNHYEKGTGYTSKKFNDYSNVVCEIINENKDIYSNAYALISYLSKKKAYLMPLKDGVEVDTQSISVTELKNKIQSRKAVILFSYSFEKPAFLNKEQTLNTFDDNEIEFFYDGFIVK